MESPYPTLAQPLVGETKPPFRPPRPSLFQGLWRGVFAVGVVVALILRLADQQNAWRVAFPVPTLAGLVLVLCWRAKPGWECGAYAGGVVAGLLVSFLGDIVVWAPRSLQLFHLAFLLYLCAQLCFAMAVWAPSVAVSRLADPNVDTSMKATPARSAGVPLQAMRMVPLVALLAGALVYWRGDDWSEASEFAPVCTVLAAQSLFVWRAAARIGYRVPVPSTMVSPEPAGGAGAAVRAPPRRPERRSLRWEHVGRQWAALWGAGAIALAHDLLGYNHLWAGDSIKWVPYASAVLYWFGLACIVFSVPVSEPPLPDLNDPCVCPPLYDGAPMRVLIILPDTDFDVTEVAVPWFQLKRRGHEVIFATERGRTPTADPLLLTGVLFGELGADPLPKLMYFEMERDPAFRMPITWDDIVPDAYDGLLLPGGHAPGMKQYLSSLVVQRRVAEFWQMDRPVGAICHGVLVLARATALEAPVGSGLGSPMVDTRHGRGGGGGRGTPMDREVSTMSSIGPASTSVLNGVTTTCLPAYMEQTAFALTCCCRGRYYRTYPETVEEEVRAAVGRHGHFLRGPVTFTRGTPWDNSHAYVVEHGKLISARWPGDAFLFARRFLYKLEEVQRLY